MEDSWSINTIWPFLVPGFGYLLTLILIRWVLLTKKRNPVSSVAWIMAIVTIPIVGGFLFLVFGINRVERRISRKEKASRSLVTSFRAFTQFQIIPAEVENPFQQRMMRLTSRIADTFPTRGNKVDLLKDTNRTLGLIEQAIHAAESTIHLEYYIWQPDRTGSRLRDLLIAKAKEGVKIRFLYDQIGSLRLSKKFLKPMLEAGIQVSSFLPGKSFRERWSINLRNHRKIVIVDGRVGFTGGMNIGDEYLGKNPSYGYWRDTHLKLEGPTVLQLQQVFAEDWYYATDENIVSDETFPEINEAGTLEGQIVTGAPSGETDSLLLLMFSAINEARESITLATSYFAPPQALVAALESAAYRGVDVRLLVAGRSAYRWTIWAGRSYYDTLLNAGVTIHEYTRGLLHSKTLTVDGTWSLVGTPNFDARSLMLNFEVALAIYNSAMALQLEEHYQADLEWATQFLKEDWDKRSTWQKIRENACRLFAPIM